MKDRDETLILEVLVIIAIIVACVSGARLLAILIEGGAQ